MAEAKILTVHYNNPATGEKLPETHQVRLVESQGKIFYEIIDESQKPEVFNHS